MNLEIEIKKENIDKVTNGIIITVVIGYALFVTIMAIIF